MNPAVPLGGRDALEAVPPGFVVKAGEVLGIDLKPQRRQEGILSGETISQADVCRHQVMGQELGVFTALGGADLDDAFHGR